jgi:uncharacterized protein (UPF0218 family)
MPTYYLPEKLRPELRKIWGIPIFGKKLEVAKKFQRILKEKKFKKVITVGDYCSLSLPSDIKIFDKRIERKMIKKIPKFSFKANNPPGTIQKEVWPIIKKAIKNKENVFIEGEEDLLVIPSVLLAEKNSAIVYGFPKKGVCLIEVTSKTKREFEKLLRKFWKGKPKRGKCI